MQLVAVDFAESVYVCESEVLIRREGSGKQTLNRKVQRTLITTPLT